MIALSAADVAAVVGGTWVPTAGDEAVEVTGVARLDSRDVEPGDLFVAYSGAVVDGHDYVDQALARGAVLTLATREVPGPHVRVDDPTAAITELARHNASALPSTCVVMGVTGSSGKTSTKDLLAAVLETVGPTVAPPGSFNNEIGLPLTVLRADASTRFLVLEMGARGPGHVAHLCEVARPSVGLVLNVGSAHLSEFGDADAIAQAKGELVEALPADGVAVLNGDDPRVAAMASRTQARVVLFGTTESCSVRATDVSIDERGRASFTLLVEGQPPAEVQLRVSGRHQVLNALAATAAATAVGIPVEQVAVALSAAEARSRWRMEVTETADGITVVNDAYNANPESMAAALRAVADIAGERRIGLVLGEMLELGPASAQAHRTVGADATGIGAAWVIGVGAVAAELDAGATGAGAPAGLVLAVDDAAAASRAAQRLVQPGDVVLVKASRGVGLEVVAASFAGSASTITTGGAA